VDENGASLIGLACNSDLTSSDLSKFQVVQCKQNVNVDAQKKVKTLTYSPSGHSKVSSTPAIIVAETRKQQQFVTGNGDQCGQGSKFGSSMHTGAPETATSCRCFRLQFVAVLYSTLFIEEFDSNH